MSQRESPCFLALLSFIYSVKTTLCQQINEQQNTSKKQISLCLSKSQHNANKKMYNQTTFHSVTFLGLQFWKYNVNNHKPKIKTESSKNST